MASFYNSYRSGLFLS